MRRIPVNANYLEPEDGPTMAELCALAVRDGIGFDTFLTRALLRYHEQRTRELDDPDLDEQFRTLARPDEASSE